MLADRLKTLAPSPTLAMQAKAKAMRAQGINVISFGAGEPDFDTPARIKEAASGWRSDRPSTPGGGPKPRRGLSQTPRDQGLDYAPDEVVVSCGAKHPLQHRHGSEPATRC